MKLEIHLRRGFRLSVAVIGMSVIAGFCGAAHSQAPCPGTRSLEISDAPFHLSYESWKETRSGFVIYGRCVKVLNEQEANIDWIGAQLSGVVRPEFPQFAMFEYSLDVDELRESELRYGVELAPERSKKVNFLANSLEGDYAETVSRITQMRNFAIDGQALPEDVLRAKSHAEVNFTVRETTYRMVVDFTSELDIEPIFRYRLQYATKPIDDLNPLQTTISLRTSDPRLSWLLQSSGIENGQIVLSEPSGDFEFSVKALAVDPADRSTTQGNSTFDVVVSGDVVARFPISYYAPH